MKRKMHLVLALVLSGAVAFAEDPGNTAPPRQITLHEAVQ